MLRELEDKNSVLIIEEYSKAQLKDKIPLLQNPLSDEKGSSEVLSKSLEDCKQWLKVTQAENVELKTQIDEANDKMFLKTWNNHQFWNLKMI